MKDIIDILKDSGIEVAEDKTTDLRKAVAEHYKTINEFNKKLDKLGDYEKQLSTANDTITDLKGKLQNAEKVDVAALQQKIADYEQAEQTRKQEETAAQELQALKERFAPLKGEHKYINEYTENAMVSVEKYAPGAILGEIKRTGIEFDTTISKTTFYRYIDEGLFLTITNKDLPVKKNKDKQKYDRVQPNRAPAGKSIEKRPAEIAERSSFGHWEMDCVEGKKGTKKTFLVLTERYSRYEIIRIMKDHTSASVIKALNGIERAYGADFCKIFQTITIDNGSEFSDYEGLEKSCRLVGSRTAVYYCHPYSAYERGSNENQNKMIRRHYPKGVSLEKVTTADTRKLEKWINNYPREIFDYYTAADIYEACVNSLLSA